MKDIGKENDIQILVKIRQKGSLTEACVNITCLKGMRLLEALQKQEIFLPAYCGGIGACGKCRVRLIKGSLPVTAEDRLIFSQKELDKGMRLACKAIVQENIEIYIENVEENFFAVAAGEAEVKKQKITYDGRPQDFGIAVDIGTTTLAFSLIEMQSGNIVDSNTRVNSQRKFGADVISRIQASNDGKKAELMNCIKQDLLGGVEQFVKQNLSQGQRVRKIVIAGNTVMLHLLRGYSCEGFCRYPFEPEMLDLEELEFESVFGKSLLQIQQAEVTLLPGISAFVGADITAGLLSCNILEKGRTSLFLDLGTNGEMALCAGGRIAVASAAAGPVFEGGTILWGTGSIAGAISKVRICQNHCEIQTIGKKPPIGICGTGVIEAAAELFLAGLMDKTGKLTEPFFSDGYPLAQTDFGEWIIFTQKDIRELQMAKAAIRSGIEILLLHMGIRYEEIDNVYLAGGFGYFLDAAKAAAIGLLPKKWLSKTKAVGNTSLKGALSYLVNQDKKSLQKIMECAEEISLANDEYFGEFYYNNIDFS